ncbi:MAG: hypothetical protein ACE5DY_00580, partial [Mariprofundaceae bacterium]
MILHCSTKLAAKLKSSDFSGLVSGLSQPGRVQGKVCLLIFLSLKRGDYPGTTGHFHSVMGGLFAT